MLLRDCHCGCCGVWSLLLRCCCCVGHARWWYLQSSISAVLAVPRTGYRPRPRQFCASVRCGCHPCAHAECGWGILHVTRGLHALTPAFDCSRASSSPRFVAEACDDGGVVCVRVCACVRACVCVNVDFFVCFVLCVCLSVCFVFCLCAE